MAQSDEEKWLQYAEEYGSPLEDQNKVVVVEEEDIDETMSIPGLQYNIDPTTSTRATPLRYVQLHLSSLFRKISAMLQTVTNAVSDLAQIKTETNAAKDAANQAASDVSDAIDMAETVNAALEGYTVTITDHDGVSRSVDIGFDMYRTYTSVSAMNADAANVPQGKFVVIATTDPTSEDNAKMYCKNSQGSFTFLCDIDQASSAAWADWLNNMKPVIQQSVSDANTAATNANNKASLANTAAQNADNKASTAQSQGNDAESKGNFAKTQGDYAKAWNDHPPYIGNDNYWYLYNTTTHAYVRAAYAKGNDLDYSTMTPEEVQMLIDNIKSDLIVASVETCESIIDELT